MSSIYPLNIGDVGMDIPAPPRAAFEVPVKDGLRGAFFLAHGVENAKKNWAPGGADHPASFIADPVVGPNYIQMTMATVLQTDIDESVAMSLLVIGRRTAGDPAAFVGNYGGGLAPGIDIFGGATYVQGGAARVTTGNATMALASDPTAWSALSLIAPATGTMAMKNFLTDVTGTSSQSDNRVVNGPGPIRIGGAYTGLAGTSQIAAAFVYDRALNAIERDTMGAYMLDYMSDIGLA